MTKQLQNFPGICFIIIIFCLLSSSTVYATGPSIEDINSAHTILKGFSNLQAENMRYEKSLKANSSNITTGAALKPYISILINAAKTFYQSIYALKPSPAFKTEHQMLMQNSYKNHKILLQVNKMIDEKATPEQVIQFINQNNVHISKQYKTAIEKVLDKVHSWPNDAHQKVFAGVSIR